MTAKIDNLDIRCEIGKNMQKPGFDRRLVIKNISSATSSQQISALKVNKPAMKKFRKNLLFGVDVKL